MSALLSGYYGQANFGDDVLLATVAGLVRERWPGTRLSVRSASHDHGYVLGIAGADSNVVPFGERTVYDLIVHGGGGVYFDFGHHNALNQAANLAIGAVGPRRYVVLEDLTRRLLGRPRTAARKRIGLGLGVGRYSPGSPRLRAALPELLDYSYLGVRDPGSVQNLHRLGLELNPRLGSDLAFLGEHWAGAVPRKAGRGQRPKVGVVLRDWPTGGPSTDLAFPMLPHIDQLSSRYEITLFAFDEKTDPWVIAAAAGRQIRIWRPNETTVAEYAGHIAAQDVVVTSRAHGAICGAVLGVPSVILAIEPKLDTVHAMLPDASRRLAPGPRPIEAWTDALDQALAIPADVVASDVARNRALTAAMVEEAFAHVS